MQWGSVPTLTRTEEQLGPADTVVDGDLGLMKKLSLLGSTLTFPKLIRVFSPIFPLGCGHVSSDAQLQNSLKTDLCLDQGPDTENVPIVYICHGMTPQVSLQGTPVSRMCM